MNQRRAEGSEAATGGTPRAHAMAGDGCVLPPNRAGAQELDAAFCQLLDDAGCPLAQGVHKRLDFEVLMTELSSQFINIPASQVDSQIEWGLRRIVELLDIDRCGLGQVSADGGQLVVTHSYQVAGVPPSARIMLDAQFPCYARMICQGRVIRLPDDLPADATGEREYCLRTGLKSNVTIPLIAMGAVVGGIGFSTFRSQRSWPDSLIPRLRLLGDMFTNALARKRADEALSAKELSLRQAQEGLRRLATRLMHSQEEERARIAREMHDDWTQRLAMLGIDLARLEGHFGLPSPALPVLQAMRERVVSLAEDVHALSRQLHPSILDDLGLVEALRSECAAFSRREDIAVDYRTGQVPGALPKELALCFYRVAQESLRNLARHAAVSEASVTLTATGPELTLQISDQGVGFDPEHTRSQPGLGLASMKERVHLIAGELTIHSAPGHGTVVTVRAPLESGGPRG